MEALRERRALEQPASSPRRLRLLEPLRGREAFRLVRTKGAIFEGKFLKFHHLCRPDQQAPFLVAVNVNKRHGAAARRNRVKRRIRESLRVLVGEQVKEPITNRIYCSVVIVYTGAKGKPLDRVRFTDIHRDIRQFMNAIHPVGVSK